MITNRIRDQSIQDTLNLTTNIEPLGVVDVFPTLNLIIKSDVHGSLEAILGSLHEIPQHEVKIKIVSSGVGEITGAQVDLANTTKSTLLSFNTITDKTIRSNCEEQKCTLSEHTVIYNLIDGVKEMMADLLPPVETSYTRGEAEVLQVFSINNKSKIDEIIAGSRVLSGKIQRDKSVRVMRMGNQLWTGKIKTFKHIKKDISEASKGLECGIGLEGYRDIQAGDVIQSFEVVKTKRKLT